MFCTWVAFILALVVIPMSFADTLEGLEEYCTDEINLSRTSMADLIVIATIDRLDLRRDKSIYGGMIFADIDILVEESLKGLPKTSRVNLLSPGGTLEGSTYLFGDYRFSEYRKGDRVLLYLKFNVDLGSYEVLYHYFKIEKGLVVDGHNPEEPPTSGYLLSELDLKRAIHEYMVCSTPMRSTAYVDSVRAFFGLEYPYSVDRLEMLLDGGSHTGVIRDARGRKLLFAWDGREPDGTPADCPRLSYVGAANPTDTGAKPLGIASPEERALIFVLRSFADSQIPRSFQDSLYTVRFDYSRPWESRRHLLGPLVKDQMMALNTLWIARYLERQARPGGLKEWPWPKPP
jgi:hypothetical protein